MANWIHDWLEASIGCTVRWDWGEISRLKGGLIQRKTSISFSKKDEVKEVKRMPSLAPDDPKALWFQKEELQNITAKLCTNIIAAVERWCNDSQKALHTCSLESHIGQSSMTKINAAYEAVVIDILYATK